MDKSKIKNPLPFILMIMIIFLSTISIFTFNIYSDINSKNKLQLASQSRYLKDPSSQIDFENIISSQYNNYFKENNKDSFTFGLGRDSYWIKTDISNILIKDITSQSHVLYLDYSGIHKINIYIPTISDGVRDYSLLKGGIYYPGIQDEIGHFFPTFKLPKNLDTSRPLYTNIKSDYSKNFSMGIQDETKFWREQQFNLFLLALSYGIMIAMILYNLVLFLALKDKTYIYYVGYMFFMLIYQIGVIGSLKVLNFNLGEALEKQIIASTFISISFALLFAVSFLNIPKFVPKAIIPIKVFIAINILGVLLVLTGNIFHANHLAYLPGAVLPFFIMIVAIKAYLRGKSEAKYYIIATVMLFSSIFIFVLRRFGLVEHNFISSYAISLSASLESIFLSFALAERISYLKKREEVGRKKTMELKSMVNIDSLTEIYNRRYYDENISSVYNLCCRDNKIASLIYLDIDNFKNFNDTYGHPMGDRVIKSLAKIIKENIRSEDHPCRIGGEEFAVIFPSLNDSQASLVAERIRESFEEVDFSSFAPEIPGVTISIGVAQLMEGESLDDWVSRADKNLYRAKKTGRNKVI